MSRPVRACLDMAALRHNLAVLRAATPGCRLLAVVKAEGYGHGAVRVACTLAEEVDGFAVSSIDEAMVLRAGGVRGRILLLEGLFAPDELALAARERLDVAVHHGLQVEMLEQAPPGVRVDAWLKVDTGMHRVGFDPSEVVRAAKRLERCAGASALRFMTHLATADTRGDSAAQRQLQCFAQTLGGLPGERSIANSAGVLGWPDSHAQWVRPGIALYGISPFVGSTGVMEGLRPVMTLASRLIAVKHVPKGGAIGYGGSWVCPEDMPVGVVAGGYGDGYPRHAPSGTPVLVNGHAVALVGRVSMDMLTVDLREQPEAQPGDPVVLWGRGLPVEEVAASAGTIGYELVCHLASRVPLVENEEPDAGAGQAGSRASSATSR